MHIFGLIKDNKKCFPNPQCDIIEVSIYICVFVPSPCKYAEKGKLEQIVNHNDLATGIRVISDEEFNLLVSPILDSAFNQLFHSFISSLAA